MGATFLLSMSFYELQDRDVPFLRWNTAIPYDATTGFWEAKEHEEHHAADEDGEEPEDGAPAEILIQQATDYWTECWAQGDAHAGIANIFTSFGSGDYICNYGAS